MDNFPDDAYRSPYCHECRHDPERLKVAMKADGRRARVVQELRCRGCNALLAWWHFSKLPLTEAERKAVNERGGKAW